jgi:hypothetical protein
MLTGSSFTLHPAAQAAGTAAQATAPTASTPAQHDFTFGDFLDIINPLQHIPVVGTLYRWVTGDTIKTPEKIAGDTLYGGAMGAISSVADTLFEQATGKNFGDTILSFFVGRHDDKPTAVAANTVPKAATTSASMTAAVATPAPAPASAPKAQTSSSPDVAALAQSLRYRGVNQDLAARALYAYRRTASLSPAAAAPY